MPGLMQDEAFVAALAALVGFVIAAFLKRHRLQANVKLHMVIKALRKLKELYPTSHTIDLFLDRLWPALEKQLPDNIATGIKEVVVGRIIDEVTTRLRCNVLISAFLERKPSPIYHLLSLRSGMTKCSF